MKHLPVARRLARWLVVAGALVVAGPYEADAEPPEIEYGAAKTLFLTEVGGKIDAELAAAKAALAAAKTPEEREARAEAVKHLTQLKRQVSDVTTFDALWDSLKQAKEAIKTLADQAASGYSAESALNPEALTLKALRDMPSLQKLSLLSKGADVGLKYFNVLKGLNADLAAVEASELSPGAKRLSAAMTKLTTLMSTFGDKVPLVGSFIKAYGDVGGGLLKATRALDAKIKAQEGGLLMPGVHGDRRYMLSRLEALGFSDATGVGSLRDVFVTNDNHIVIWDRAKRDWVVADRIEPGLTVRELERRYLYYAKHGKKNPVPDDLLRGFRKLIALELEPSAEIIAPGASVTLTPTARRVVDDKPVTTAYVRVTLARHSGLGAGTFTGPTLVRVGTPVRWTAPDNLNEVYTFEARLDYASGQFWRTTGPARAWVRTGAATRVSLDAAPATVSFGEATTLTARVTTADGAPVPASARGELTLSVSPPAGSFGAATPTTDSRGLVQAWTAPDKPGRYTITASWRGATADGLFGTHLQPSTATTVVEVRPPALGLTLSPATAKASTKTPAVFHGTLTNPSRAPLTVRLGGGVGPAAAKALWRWTKRPPRSLTVPAGGEVTFEVGVVATDPARASTLEGHLHAAIGDLRVSPEVRFTATHEPEAREVRVTVSIREKDAKASAAGGHGWRDRAFAPGDLIPLRFQVWGPQREYCVRGALERNAGMRRVRVTEHGPQGCAWGTTDGRMSTHWRAEDEPARWSGPGLVGGTTGPEVRFKVPDKPGTYTITATGSVLWRYELRAAGRRTKQVRETGSATFTITVSPPK